MTRRHPYVTKFDASRVLSATIAHTIGPAVDRLVETANTENDGYPATTPANGTPGAGNTNSTSSSVETHAIARIANNKSASNALYELGEWIQVHYTATQRIVHLLNNHGGEPITESLLRRLRCVTCEARIADPVRADGRCIECGKDHDQQRARIEQNRRIRRRTA